MATTNPNETLIRALTEAGVPFERDENGVVRATPEVTAFLEGMGALHDPENPVVKTKAEIEAGPEEEYADPDTYELVVHDTPEEVEAALSAGTVTYGNSNLSAPTRRHRGFEVYQGPIRELRGEMVLIKRNPKEAGVAVQFNNSKLVLNGRALGFGWHDFPTDHFSDTRPFAYKWRDIPSRVRAHVRRARKVPRFQPDNSDEFQGRKEMRRGTPGAFGGPGAQRQRDHLLARASHRAYLVNVIVEGDGESKSLAVEATSEKQALEAARVKHKAEFPDMKIQRVELHRETRSRHVRKAR